MEKNNIEQWKRYTRLALAVAFVALLVALYSISVSGAKAISQEGSNFTIGKTLDNKVISFWDNTNKNYWYLKNKNGEIYSYWSEIQVQSWKTTGGGSWQTEIKSSYNNYKLDGNTLIQNYTLDSGGYFNQTFIELDNNIKMIWKVKGGYNRNYRLVWYTNYIPTLVKNNSGNKRFIINDDVIFDWSDITDVNYTVTTEHDTNGKTFKVIVNVGNAYLEAKEVDPTISGGALGYYNISTTGVGNNSWINFSSAFNAISGTYNISKIIGWWNSSWSYSIHNNITNGSRPYQINLNISNSTGTNNATHMFCNGNCNVNFTDIRFILDNTTELPYWIEDNTTEVWVNITGNGSVSMYYGNTAATTTSNGANTFIQWHGATASYFKDSAVVSIPFIYEAKIKTGGNGYQLWGVVNAVGELGDALEYNRYVQSVSFYRDRYFSVKDSVMKNELSSGAGSFPDATWKRSKIIAVNTTSATNTFTGESDIVLTSNVPPDVLGLSMRLLDGTGEQAFSFIRHYSIVEPVWATWGTEEFIEFTAWVIPQNHPQSEIKTCFSYCVGNITLTEGNQIQNIQLFMNSTGTFNATVSLLYSGDSYSSSETAINGNYTQIINYTPQNYATNVTLTFPINDATFTGSTWKGTLFYVTNLSANVTGSGYNTTSLWLNLSAIAANFNFTASVTIPYNNAPTGSISNQSFEAGNSMIVTCTANDAESNTLNISMTVNSTLKQGSSCSFDYTGLTIGNYLSQVNITDLNGTIGTQPYPYVNLTFWVNVSADVTPPTTPVISNGTPSQTTLALSSTNETEYVNYTWWRKENTTSIWLNWTKTSINTTTVTGITSCSENDYFVQVYDASGNHANSSQITVQQACENAEYAAIVATLNNLVNNQIQKDNNIYISDENTVYKISDSEIVYKIILNGKVTSKIIVSENYIYFSVNNILYQVDKSSGTIIKKTVFTSNNINIYDMISNINTKIVGVIQ